MSVWSYWTCLTRNSCIVQEVITAKDLASQTDVRLMASVYFKNSVSRYWRNRRDSTLVPSSFSPYLLCSCNSGVECASFVISYYLMIKWSLYFSMLCAFFEREFYSNNINYIWAEIELVPCLWQCLIYGCRITKLIFHFLWNRFLVLPFPLYCMSFPLPQSLISWMLHYTI